VRVTPVLAALLFAALAAAQDIPPSCLHGEGALPAETLPPGAPHGNQIPIDHIVVLMQENRSFDHYFRRLLAVQPGEAAALRAASNPDPQGGAPIRPFHQHQYCEVEDLSHSWNGSHLQWNDGAMDGFTSTNVVAEDAQGARTMGFYRRRDLPFYHKLFRTFAVGGRYFCSLLGPTFPNRFYLLAGTSFGHIRNDLPGGTAEFEQRSIFNLLDEAGITWKVYQSGISFSLVFAYVRNFRAVNLVPVNEYFADAASGTLPQVSFVDPMFFGTPITQNDEHPPANVQVGEEFVSRIIKATLASPLWPSSALFLTYDEHGGFYDHVPPPPACVPDAIPPLLASGDLPGAFDRYGFRVPMVAVSPFARRRFVSQTTYDHTSILRFIETRFDLPALSARDANADPMLELFDFEHPPFMTPPRLPAAPIGPRQLEECIEGASELDES
jgi:phospholipase C